MSVRYNYVVYSVDYKPGIGKFTVYTSLQAAVRKATKLGRGAQIVRNKWTFNKGSKMLSIDMICDMV